MPIRGCTFSHACSPDALETLQVMLRLDSELQMNSEDLTVLGLNKIYM